MSIVLENLAMPSIAQTIEANMSEEMAWFGRALPQGELHKTPELLYLATGADWFNAVLQARFASHDPTYIHSKIDGLFDYFNQRANSFGWTTGPSTQPPDLAAMLEERGFAYGDSTMGMAVDLHAMNGSVQVNRTLMVTEVADLEALKIVHMIERRGFLASEVAAQRYIDVYAAASFGNSMPWHHYIGWLQGEPVAIASLLYHAGVAGVYGIATVPEARRQGVGAAITLHVLRAARKNGYRVAVLSPTDMSEALYRRIGFQEYCVLRHYHSPRKE